MSWNYRVIKFPAGFFGLYEVYYDSAGNPNGYLDASLTRWETSEEIAGSLKLMQEALEKPIIDYTDMNLKY